MVKRTQHMINSTERLHSALGILRAKTNKSNSQILEEVFVPLSEMLINLKGDVTGYYVIVQPNEITIKCYGFNGNVVFSGKATSPISQILGAD